MNTSEFEAIKRKIDTLKDRQSKASGIIESTEKQLAELGVTDIDTVDDFLATSQKEIEKLEADNEADFTELKGLHSWQFV